MCNNNYSDTGTMIIDANNELKKINSLLSSGRQQSSPKSTRAKTIV
jgi:hypothetical protein